MGLPPLAMDEVPFKFYESVLAQLSRQTRNEILDKFPKTSIVHAAAEKFRDRLYTELDFYGSTYGRLKDWTLDSKGFYEQLTIYVHDAPATAGSLLPFDRSFFEHRIFRKSPRRIGLICLSLNMDPVLYKYLTEENHLNIELASDTFSETVQNLAMILLQKERIEIFSMERVVLPEETLRVVLEQFKVPHFRDLRLRIPADSLWFCKDLMAFWRTNPRCVERKVVNLVFHEHSVGIIDLFGNDLRTANNKYGASREILSKFDARLAFGTGNGGGYFRQEHEGRSVFIYVVFAKGTPLTDLFSLSLLKAHGVHLYFE
ncbi:hypothetical protein QR680_013814 [Steinernema hermaphroditum]|uniref:Uncharacterized protein n=1 Tax=Steinernema hermaphroditum TaxID=289476 RepID=A0AA39M361_9BILA|nr:hypothetical protein QR680_013814 [Steinernema hermaphroditum]